MKFSATKKVLLLSTLTVATAPGLHANNDSHGDFEAYPAEAPCVDQNAAAGVLLIEEETRNSMTTPSHFKQWLLLKGEGLVSVDLPCTRLAAHGFCGEHAGESGYSLVSHLCPRSCGACPVGNGKASDAGDGSWQGGIDADEFVPLIYSGRTCADAQKHGWASLSCEKDAVVRALCGETCPNNCQRLGWVYEDYDKPLKKIASYQESAEQCSGVPYNRCKEMKFGEAEDACASWGAKLCDGPEATVSDIWKHASGHFNDGECSSHQNFWLNDGSKPCNSTTSGGRQHGSMSPGRNSNSCDGLSAQNSPMCCFGSVEI